MSLNELKTLAKSQLLRFMLVEFAAMKVDPRYTLNFLRFHRKLGEKTQACFSGCLIRYLHGPDHDCRDIYIEESKDLVLWLENIRVGDIRNAYRHIDDKTFKVIFDREYMPVRFVSFETDVEAIATYLESKGL